MAQRLGVLLAGFAGLGDQDHQTSMYVPALQAHPGFKIVAVTGEGKGCETAARLDVPYVESLDAALARDDVDVVSVAAAPEQRADVLIAAMQAGKTVLADKPLAATLADAQAIVEAQRRTDAMLVVAHHLRMHPMVQSAASAVAAGRVGLPWNVQADFFVAGGNHSPLGELLNFGVYPVDVVHALTGQQVHRVHAVASKQWHDGAGEDLVVLMLDHEHRMTSTIAVGRTGPRVGVRTAGVAIHRYRVSGSLGVLAVDATHPRARVVTETSARPHWTGADTVARLLDRLYTSATSGAPVPVDATAGLHALEVIDAAQRSIECGAPVSV